MPAVGSTRTRIRRIATSNSAIAQNEESVQNPRTGDSEEDPAMCHFTTRSSLLSLLDVKQSTNLTGFYHFYWVALSFFVSTTFLDNWLTHGHLLAGTVRDHCFSDPAGVLFGETLFLLCTLLSGLSVFCGHGRARALRLVFPLTALLVGTLFGFHRRWSGLQRAILLLHSLSVLMKIYAFLHHHRGVCISRNHFAAKMSHYVYFLFAPTMIYAETYPQTSRIRRSIVVERLAGIVLCGLSMYIVVEHYIYPAIVPLTTLRSLVAVELLHAYAKLLLPCSAFFLLGFFFVFEYWCNLFAELTCFADRQFYTDWWNGVSFYDFSTRWNIPVHKFLQHYVYRQLLASNRVSKHTARFLTFLLSSIFHELVMFIMMGPGKYTFAFLFLFQMLQLPLISLVVGSGWAKRHAILANWAFWIMLVIGLPTVVVCYSLFSA